MLYLLDEKENEDNLDANMVSKPAFVVSITKGNGYTLCLRCVFSENDLDNSEQTEEHGKGKMTKMRYLLFHFVEKSIVFILISTKF